MCTICMPVPAKARKEHQLSWNCSYSSCKWPHRWARELNLDLLLNCCSTSPANVHFLGKPCELTVLLTRIPEQSEEVLQCSLPEVQPFSLQSAPVNSISAHSNDIGNILKAVSLLLKCCVCLQMDQDTPAHTFFFVREKLCLCKRNNCRRLINYFGEVWSEILLKRFYGFMCKIIILL